MTILNEKPPAWLYDRCVKEFGADFDKGNVFTYGDVVYAKDPIPGHLAVHESVHIKQQDLIGKDAWWEKYFTDRLFRMREEVEAYRAEYLDMKENIKDRNSLDKALRFLSNSLSHDYKLGINTLQASALIKNKQS